MAKSSNLAQTWEQTERVIFLLENLLILEALAQGVKVEDVRSLLKLDKRRINNVSKMTKSAKK